MKLTTFLPLLLLFTGRLTAAPLTGADGVTVEIAKADRLVALNASTVEILMEFGLTDSIVATDNGGERVLGAGKAIGLGHPYRPSVEGIIAQKPDLVIVPRENIKEPPLEQLRTAKVPVLVLENSALDGIEGLKRRIAMVAKAVDREEQGRDLISRITKRMEVIQQQVAALPKRKKICFVYAHGPGSALIYGRNTGAHALIELAGGINAADFTEGTKPMTAETFVLLAPDEIIMLNRGFEAVGGIEGTLALPGISLTPAGRARAVHIVDDNIRWIGPRFPDEVEKLHRALYPAPVTPPAP